MGGNTRPTGRHARRGAPKEMMGAEAVLKRVSILGLPSVEKRRQEKGYRNAKLDALIRAGRTRREARLLAKAKRAGVLCPLVFRVTRFSIFQKRLRGRTLHRELASRRMTRGEISSAAKILARLHSHGIIHGDYTPANLMLTPQGMAVIDFGLGSISADDEDRATDVVMMKKSLGAQGDRFVEAYLKAGGARPVARRVSGIEKRARYMERG